MKPLDVLLRRLRALDEHVRLSGDYGPLRSEVLTKLAFALEEYDSNLDDWHRAEETERAERESEVPFVEGLPW